jgi:hypothetical protein
VLALFDVFVRVVVTCIVVDALLNTDDATVDAFVAVVVDAAPETKVPTLQQMT